VVGDNRPVVALLREAKAEVTEVKVVEEEIDESAIYVRSCFTSLTYLASLSLIMSSNPIALLRALWHF